MSGNGNHGTVNGATLGPTVLEEARCIVSMVWMIIELEHGNDILELNQTDPFCLDQNKLRIMADQYSDRFAY